MKAKLDHAVCNEGRFSFRKRVCKGFAGVVFTLTAAALLVSPSSNCCTRARAQDLICSSSCSFQNDKAKARTRTDADKVAETVKLLYFYEVKGGHLKQCAISRDSLERGEPIKVDGYVCGIVAFCGQEMSISVDGQAMAKIRKNGDGTFSLMRFGTIKPEDFSINRTSRAYYGELEEKGRSGAFLKGGYSLFPEVGGDAISPGNRFHITLSLDGKSITLPVEQQGYVDVRNLPVVSSSPNGETLAFRYLGTRLAALRQEAPDFDGRLQAIAAGVSNVKKILGADLVSDVNILDYGDVYNALTSNTGKDMWIYSTAFRKEPVAELETIAEHETLHRFVTRIGFTSDSELRELFSDLRGFGECSLERFLTVASGQTPIERGADGGSKDSVFFSFINEKNFLDHMKGGHSHQNIDEYCASFVHSLMYVDRLEGNLNRSIECAPSERPRYLTPQEKALVLNDYIKTVEAMRDSLTATGRSQDINAGPIDAILKYASSKATDIKDRLQGVTIASAQESVSPN